LARRVDSADAIESAIFEELGADLFEVLAHRGDVERLGCTVTWAQAEQQVDLVLGLQCQRQLAFFEGLGHEQGETAHRLPYLEAAIDMGTLADALAGGGDVLGELTVLETPARLGLGDQVAALRSTQDELGELLDALLVLCLTRAGHGVSPPG
jgi:hypothetical protein